MNITNRAVTVLAASVALLSQGVLADTAVAPIKLAMVQGDVMVNNGSRFVKAVPGQELKPGAKVVTAKSSNVSLIYQNGCVKEMKQNSMLTVGTPEQCAAMIQKERIYVANNAMGQVDDPALATGANHSAANISGRQTGQNSGGFLSSGFGAGAGFTGVFGVCLADNCFDDSPRNASPR